MGLRDPHEPPFGDSPDHRLTRAVIGLVKRAGSYGRERLVFPELTLTVTTLAHDRVHRWLRNARASYRADAAEVEDAGWFGVDDFRKPFCLEPLLPTAC
ncbi:MAG: hypothetical protein JOZ19_09625 [Rubrobacter sp.]|nr:hypothetical protein [Rubrobacter sp.]